MAIWTNSSTPGSAPVVLPNAWLALRMKKRNNLLAMYDGNILDKIVAVKREEVGRLQVHPRAAARENLLWSAKAFGPRRDFADALRFPRRGNIALIAEVKKASPSAGVIRADFDPVRIAQAYEAAGASALSVLTDEKFFQGKLDYIRAVRERVKLPVLRKDFIIDPYQVYEARAAGADAILLIAECLETSEMIDLQILATEMNLTVLIEVHDLDNLMRVRDH